MRTHHKFYDEHSAYVRKVRDCLGGEDQVKDQGQLYLPQPDGMSANQFAAYKERAYLFPVAERALRGLVGIALHRDPIMELPKRLTPMLERATFQGGSLDTLTEWVLRETLSVGYSALLLDMPTDGNAVLTTPYVAKFEAEAILDYRQEIRDGRAKLVHVRLQDNVGQPDDGIERHIVLDADPIYTVTRYEVHNDEPLQVGDDQIPIFNGQPLTEIPIVFPSPFNLDPMPERPPFLDLANACLSHYRNSADLEHVLYLTCAPTPVTIGNLTDKEKPNTIGAGAVWHMPEGGDAKYMEVEGSGIQHMRDVMATKEEHMAAIAARFIHDGMNRNEQPMTAKMRLSGELSLLRGAIRNTELAMLRLLKMAARWVGADEDEVRFEMAHDLLTGELDPRMLDSLSKALMAGQISYSTFIYNLQKAEIVPRDRSHEDEREMIETDGGGALLP